MSKRKIWRIAVWWVPEGGDGLPVLSWVGGRFAEPLIYGDKDDSRVWTFPRRGDAKQVIAEYRRRFPVDWTPTVYGE